MLVMQLIKYPSREIWDELLVRPSIDNKLLLKQVGKIIEEKESVEEWKIFLKKIYMYVGRCRN